MIFLNYCEGEGNHSNEVISPDKLIFQLLFHYIIRLAYKIDNYHILIICNIYLSLHQ